MIERIDDVHDDVYTLRSVIMITALALSHSTVDIAFLPI